MLSLYKTPAEQYLKIINEKEIQLFAKKDCRMGMKSWLAVPLMPSQQAGTTSALNFLQCQV